MASEPGREPPAAEFSARLRAALCGPDLSAVAALLSPGVTYRHHRSGSAPESGSEGMACRGREPVLGWLRTVTAEGLRLLLVETAVAPPRHVLLVVRLGDGARRDQLLVFVVTVAGAVISDIREFPDREAAMVHVGLAPAAPEVLETVATAATAAAGAFRFAVGPSVGRRVGGLGVTTVRGARRARGVREA